jgi:hypothetical protein
MGERTGDIFQNAARASDNQIVIGVNEVPPSQAMEMGKIMPALGEQ